MNRTYQIISRNVSFSTYYVLGHNPQYIAYSWTAKKASKLSPESIAMLMVLCPLSPEAFLIASIVTMTPLMLSGANEIDNLPLNISPHSPSPGTIPVFIMTHKVHNTHLITSHGVWNPPPFSSLTLRGFSSEKGRDMAKMASLAPT